MSDWLDAALSGRRDMSDWLDATLSGRRDMSNRLDATLSGILLRPIAGLSRRREVGECVRRLARVLLEWGVGREERVAVGLERACVMSWREWLLFDCLTIIRHGGILYYIIIDMNILPKEFSQFQDKSYWNNFYKKLKKKSKKLEHFEWYGQYSQY